MINNENSDEENEIILSVSWEKNILAACYYKLSTMELCLTYEGNDSAPEFSYLANIFRHIKPNYLIGSGGEIFLKNLMEKCNLPKGSDLRNYRFGKCGKNVGGPSYGNFFTFPSNTNNKQILVQNRERILSLYLPGMRENFTSDERRIFIESILPMQQNLVVQCFGNLLHYLDNTWRRVFFPHNNAPIFTNLKMMFLETWLRVDDCTLSSLQIFTNQPHPSALKDNVSESLSVYSLLSKGCVSTEGCRALRALLLQPTRDYDELKCSHNTIQWCLRPENHMKVQIIRNLIKKIHNVGQVFKNISLRPNNVNAWNKLREIASRAYLIWENCKHMNTPDAEGTMISLIANSFQNIIDLQQIFLVLEFVIDFEGSLKQGQFIVQTQFDVELDEKKYQMIRIMDSIDEQIQQDCTNLPDFVSKISTYYIPEIGYVLKVIFIENNPQFVTQLLQNKSLELITQIDDEYFFKSSSLQEINENFGHLYVEISEHEIRIRERLLKFLRKNLPNLQKIVILSSKFDYMMAFADVAKRYNFTCPQIGDEKIMKINKGRHILWDLKTQFISNDTDCSIENKNLITILTAPNASGKSVYMKQIGLIAFLAHIGSFVPAEYAKIPRLKSIHCLMHCPESMLLGTSSFLADLQQMRRILMNSTNRSLVLIDEFGKGTNDVEGEALLISCIEKLLLKCEKCPITFISTHYTNAFDFIENKEFVISQTFENKNTSSGGLKSTYKLKSGKNTTTRYADKVDGVKQILDGIFKEDSSNEQQDNYDNRGHSTSDQDHLESFDLRAMKVRLMFNIVKKYLEDGTIEDLDKMLESWGDRK